MVDSQKQSWIHTGLLILLITALYGSVITHGFVWDDYYIIATNPQFDCLDNISRLFLVEDTVDESTGYYRPVTYVTFALERAIWGANPTGYHAANLLLHIVTVLLFFRVVGELFGRERLAFMAAFIFALHPLAGESVNFLAGGRNTLLCASFGLLAFLCHLKKRPFAAFCGFTAAIFSKEFALLLPAVFLFTDIRLRREQFRASRYIPYLFATTGYLILRANVVEKANFLSGVTSANVLKAPYLLVQYLINTLVPFNLKVMYQVTPETTVSLICLGIVTALTTALFFRRDNEVILFASGWFLLFLLPVLNIVPLPTASLMADRYAYFSLMGGALFLSSVFCSMKKRWATVAAVLFCLLCAGVVASRNSIWKDEISFFTRMTVDAPESFVGFKNLGMVHYRKGELIPALNALAQADTKRDIPYNYLTGNAYLYWKEHLPDRVEQVLRKASELEPGRTEPYLIMMLLEEQRGNVSRAAEFRWKAEAMVPDLRAVLTARVSELCRGGESNLQRGLLVDAEILFWQALQIDQRFIPALIDMGTLRARQGNFNGARQYLERVLAIEPANAAAHANLVTLYRTRGHSTDVEQEESRYREAVARLRKPVT